MKTALLTTPPRIGDSPDNHSSDRTKCNFYQVMERYLYSTAKEQCDRDADNLTDKVGYDAEELTKLIYTAKKLAKNKCAKSSRTIFRQLKPGELCYFKKVLRVELESPERLKTPKALSQIGN